MEVLPEGVLQLIDMSGTLRTQWEVVGEHDGRVSVRPVSSHLWDYDGMRSVFQRLL